MNYKVWTQQNTEDPEIQRQKSQFRFTSSSFSSSYSSSSTTILLLLTIKGKVQVERLKNTLRRVAFEGRGCQEQVNRSKESLEPPSFIVTVTCVILFFVIITEVSTTENLITVMIVSLGYHSWQHYLYEKWVGVSKVLFSIPSILGSVCTTK